MPGPPNHCTRRETLCGCSPRARRPSRGRLASGAWGSSAHTAVRSRRVRAGAVAGPPWATHGRRGTQTPRDGGRDSPVDVPSTHPRPRRRAASGDARQPGPHRRRCGRTVRPSLSPAPALPRGRRRDWPPGPAGGVLGGDRRTRAGDQRGRGQVPLGSGDLAPGPSPLPPLPWQRPAAVTQGRTAHVGPGQARPSLLCGF